MDGRTTRANWLRNISHLMAGMVIGALLVTVAPHLLQSTASAQQSGCQTFKETGKTVCGKFLQYWQQHGGLMQNGLPISNEFTEYSPLDGLGYQVQYFERALFELHPEKKPPYDVLLAQLGTFRFQELYNGQEPVQGPSSALGTPVSIPTARPGTGVITGKLSYPSEVIPRQDICALEINGARYYCVSTDHNQPNYVIAGVEPGTYYVLSYPYGSKRGDNASAAYTKAVQCGLRVSCTDHSLVPVKVTAGKVTGGADVGDWYGRPPGGFPSRP